MAVAQTVNSIVVEGNRRVEAATIRSYFKPGPGGRLGPAEIDEALKALYATGLFSDVRISHAGGRLVVTVVENPVINRVAFEGNKKAKDTQLRSRSAVEARGTLSKPTVQADVQRIIEIYHRSGRFDVTVVPKIIELPNNRVNLVFEINEGAKTGVKEIRFVGAHAFSSGPPEERDQDHRDQLATASCRPPTSTIPTAWKPTAICCGASISTTAMPTCASCRRSASMIRRRRASSSPSRSMRARNTTSAAWT